MMVTRLLAMALALCCPGASVAQVTPRSVAAWADGTFGQAVRGGRASAATVVVVKDGKPILTRTYGHADVATKAPVAPPRNRFLIASVTKTFTATAIALLVEDGRIASLDDPANTYLKRMKLPDGFGRPITLRQLLTHSAGFEERGFGVGRHDDASAPASAAYVRARLPKIVRAPGSRMVYANIDPPLLGMVVEDITGMTMRDFVERRILRPMGMGQTELVYDPAASARLVHPYVGARAIPPEINSPFYAPTGSIHTDAADMGRYMLAQLGHMPAALPPAAVARLHAPLARNAPALDPLAMAFFVSRWNGHRTVGHAGVFSGFSSDLLLVPGQRLGVFYSWAGGPRAGKPLDFGELQSSFLTLALGRFRAPPPIAAQPDPSAFYGRYWQERRPQSNFEAIVAAGQVVTVAPAAGNRLTINGEGPYYAFAPASYTRVTDDGRPGAVYVFGPDHVSQRVGAATRVSGLGDPRNQTLLAVAAIAVLATGLLGAVWMRGRARLLAPSIGLLALAVPLLLFVVPPGLEPDIIAGRYARFLLLKLDLIAIVAAAAALGWLLARQGGTRVARIHAALIGVAATTLIVPFAFFHLI